MKASVFFISLFVSLNAFASTHHSSIQDPPIDFSQTLAKNTYAKRQRKLAKEPIQPSRYPYWAPLEKIEHNSSVFFQPNVGIGFLYFRKLKGMLIDNPNVAGFNLNFQIKRGITYNKTLLKDYMIGYRFFSWFKLAFSYQNQSGIFFNTQPIPQTATGSGESSSRRLQMTSYLSLDAIQIKAFFEMPYTLIYKKVSLAPYFALGFGPGWQTWFPVRYRVIPNLTSFAQVMDPKIFPTVTFLLDKGVRFQPARVNPNFSGVLGFKFMIWGNTRGVGRLNDQGSSKMGILQPLSIKPIYSFVPYLGFQWNFDASRYQYSHMKRRNISDMDKFFIHSKYSTTPPNFITQFNFGPNFLYFSGIKGNLGGRPASFFGVTGQNTPMKRRFLYQRTPLYEYLLGFRCSRIFQWGLSLQTSNYTVLQTPYADSFATTVNQTSKVHFKSFLNLYALMAKAYLYMPYAIRAGFVSFNYYVALGFGPSWQSWYNTQANARRNTANSVDFFRTASFHPKVIANPAFMVDMGFDMKNIHPDALFHIYLGVRYNRWGQIRNLGKDTQQPYNVVGLNKPVRVKTLYSFTPYLSFQWDFPIEKQKYLARQSTDTFRPFFAKVQEYDKQSQILFSTNIGPNFLRFSGLRGNLGMQPTALFGSNANAPMKGRISKNNPLVFEFLASYQINYWLTCSASFQNQTAIYLTTKAIPSGPIVNGTASQTNQLQSQLQLYSVMLKPYLNIPYALIIKNWAWTTYLGAGIGASWQSWANNVLMIYDVGNLGGGVLGFSDNVQNLKPKTIANVAWMLDIGFKTRNVSEKFSGSVLIGCKYIQWGQARNIGEITQQWNLKRLGLVQPFVVKTVYSFAPYLGFQWSF